MVAAGGSAGGNPGYVERGIVREGSLVKNRTSANGVVRKSANFHEISDSSPNNQNKNNDNNGNNFDNNHHVQVEAGDIDLVFFDAVEDQLADDDYPIITTSSICKSRRVSFMEPETMLRVDEWHEARFEDARAEPTADDGDNIDSDGKLKNNNNKNSPAAAAAVAGIITTLESPKASSNGGGASSPSSQSSPRPSIRKVKSSRRRVFRRGSVAARIDLEKPRITVQERGYPGQLTEEELLQCQMFYREIHARGLKDSHYLDIVYSLRGIEEEPYAICRFMRATKFDSGQQLQRLENGRELWEGAMKENFYKDIETAMGIPLKIFLNYYPYFYHGNAKNGCPVNYFRAGSLETQALLSMVPPEMNTRYFWHTFYHTFKEKMIVAKERNPDFVRCESINVIDLKGMSISQLSDEAMETMKGLQALANFFPETLHCMVILNAPTWFSMTWSIIKSFMDPRTARKITVYSSLTKGNARLMELVDPLEIPSDFGGSGQSLESSIRDACRELSAEKKDYYSSFVTLRNKNDKKSVEDSKHIIKAGEKAKVRVYTRSVYGATVSVYFHSNSTGKGGQLLGKQQVKRDNPSQFNPENNPNKAFCTDVVDVQDVAGPGKLTFEVQGLGDYDPSRKLPASGNFLIVTEVVATTTN